MKYLLGMETIYTDLEEALWVETVKNIMIHLIQVTKYLFNMMSIMLMDLLDQLNLHLVISMVTEVSLNVVWTLDLTGLIFLLTSIVMILDLNGLIFLSQFILMILELNGSIFQNQYILMTLELNGSISLNQSSMLISVSNGLKCTKQSLMEKLVLNGTIWNLKRCILHLVHVIVMI